MLGFGEVGVCGWGEAVCVVGAVGVGIFLLECEGYAGAPGSARVAGVCGGRLGGRIIGQEYGVSWLGLTR